MTDEALLGPQETETDVLREALLDLSERLTSAQRSLLLLASKRWGGDRDRLAGKAEGVALARSYLDDALRHVHRLPTPGQKPE